MATQAEPPPPGGAGSAPGGGGRPLVLVAEPIEREALDWLAERAEVIEAAPLAASPGELARAEGLLVRTYTQVAPALLERMPALRVVARAGVALENVDIRACRARGVEVVHAPGANTVAVVEFVLGRMLAMVRPHSRLERAVAEADWHALRTRESRHRELSELTLGVCGFGRIGSQLGRRAAALGMCVLYHDVREIPHDQRHGCEAVSPERLLAECDILSVHVDDRPSNRGLFGEDAFSRLKDDAVFINTSRGFVVDEAALAAWLGGHPHARAVIDVHEREPPPADAPLLGVANAHLTPHVAAGTQRAKAAMSWVVRDLWGVLCGEAPQHPAPDR